MTLTILHSPFDTWDDQRRMCYSAFMYNGVYIHDKNLVFYLFNN
jgi:hypothetical protein